MKHWSKVLPYSVVPFLLLLFSVNFAQPPNDLPSISSISSRCSLELSPWQDGASIPANHIEGATAVVNNKLYVFGGFKDSSLNITTRVDVYNPQTDVWETASESLRAMPTGLSHIQAAVHGKNVWIAGGFVGKHPGQPTDKVWRYDTEQDQWFAGPALPKARAAGFLSVVGNKLYYAGGLSNDRNTTYADHWVLKLNKPGKGWKVRTDLPKPRNHGGGVTLGNAFYTVGGQFKHDQNPKDVRHMFAFDTKLKQWSKLAKLPTSRSHAEPGTMVIEGRIVLAGGRANKDGKGQVNFVTEYNPATNSWRELRPLPVNLIAPNAAYVGGKLIVTAGGTAWNVTNDNTYISEVSFNNCN